VDAAVAAAAEVAHAADSAVLEAALAVVVASAAAAATGLHEAVATVADSVAHEEDRRTAHTR
jgi:hypothetical protein